MSKSFQENIPKELLNTSEEFKAAMQSMALHWWYYDVALKQLIISPEFRNLLGYTEEEFDPIVPTIDKNIHPDDFEENRKLFSDFIKGEIKVYEIEYRLRIDGEWCWYYNRASVLQKDQEGNAAFVGGISMDISFKYSRMIAAMEEGNMFKYIFNNTEEAVFIATIGKANKSSLIKDVNSAAASLFNCEKNDLIGKDPYTIFDLSLLKKPEELKNVLINEGSFQTEFQTKDLKGELKYLSVNAHAFTKTNEDLFIALVTDRTDSQFIKNELKASEKALRQSENIYRSLIKAAGDRIGLFEVNGTAVIINSAFSETIGYSTEEFLKLKVPERMHPEDKERLGDLAAKLYEKGSLSIEYRVQHRDGHYLHMSSKSVLLKDPDIEKEYVLFVIRDISEKIEFQKELFKAKELAIESDKLKSAFLANMSHEIRTPMNSIVGFANLLAEEDIDEASKKEYIRRINKNSTQLLALISDIIDLAKIESNQLSVSHSKVILNNLFCDLAQYGKVQLEQRGRKEVVFNYDISEHDNGLTIESDLVRLTQIMQNLVNNAVKFTTEGEITIGFELAEESKVRLYVKDTGAGIDKKNFEIIFDQFRQIDGSNVRKFGGTGLGLAICKNLTELLQGKIWLESEKGIGSTFFIELPLKSGYKIEDKYVSVPKEHVISNKTTVLVVDDDHDTLMLLVTLLRNEGIQTITADSGYRALEIMEREALPDIILMDLQMPVLNGVQTLKIIRELYPNQKVIAQSAHALEGERSRTILTGFDDYISKPFSKEALLETIQKVLGG